jgi:hypothetical protein
VELRNRVLTARAKDVAAAAQQRLADKAKKK